jgi:hypothetical protein
MRMTGSRFLIFAWSPLVLEIVDDDVWYLDVMIAAGKSRVQSSWE